MNDLIYGLLKAIDAQQGTSFMDTCENIKIIKATENGSIIYFPDKQEEEYYVNYPMNRYQMLYMTNCSWSHLQSEGVYRYNQNYKYRTSDSDYFYWNNFSTAQSRQGTLKVLKGNIYVVPYHFLPSVKFKTIGILKRKRKEKETKKIRPKNIDKRDWTCSVQF
jgi:hypothetical protein